MNSYREAAEGMAGVLRSILRHGREVYPDATAILTRFEQFNAPDRQVQMFAPPARPGRPYVAQDTSIQAAKALSKSTADSIEKAVFRFLESRADRGATDQEIASALQIHEGTCRARRVSLTAQGAVLDSGHRRKTRSGRDAIVWVAR